MFKNKRNCVKQKWKNSNTYFFNSISIIRFVRSAYYKYYGCGYPEEPYFKPHYSLR